MEEASRGVVLFADVSGSTSLYETAGDAVASAAVGHCLEIFAEQTVAFGGRVIKTIGDAVMAFFTQADGAASAAIGIQQRIDSLAPVNGNKLSVRVGMNEGAVVEREGDLFGDTVNLAARLVDVANAGQIMLTADTAKALGAGLRISCRALHAIAVKGKASEIEICELLWRGGEDEATAIVPTLRRTAMSVVRLRYAGVETVLDPSRKSFVLGRDKASDLMIPEKMASRSHARIEPRAGKFVLVDHSANGTYVSVDGERELSLHREEFVLHGHGVIALGVPLATATELIQFSCD